MQKKKKQITQDRVEYNVFLFDEPPKGSKLLKIFKMSLMFRFEKLSNLSKSVHTGENSQILTVSNKKKSFISMSQLWCISEIFLNATQNTNSTYHLHCHLELQALSQTACDVTRKTKRQNLTFVYIFRKYQIRCFNHSYGKL
jgi:hypothetical protein